jgi:hypothetical protein
MNWKVSSHMESLISLFEGTIMKGEKELQVTLIKWYCVDELPAMLLNCDAVAIVFM